MPRCFLFRPIFFVSDLLDSIGKGLSFSSPSFKIFRFALSNADVFSAQGLKFSLLVSILPGETDMDLSNEHSLDSTKGFVTWDLSSGFEWLLSPLLSFLQIVLLVDSLQFSVILGEKLSFCAFDISGLFICASETSVCLSMHSLLSSSTSSVSNMFIRLETAGCRLFIDVCFILEVDVSEDAEEDEIFL